MGSHTHLWEKVTLCVDEADCLEVDPLGCWVVFCDMGEKGENFNKLWQAITHFTMAASHLISANTLRLKPPRQLKQYSLNGWTVLFFGGVRRALSL
jgi:hypothetical protein